ncbi:MAG: porin [Betaproteobacteria bacterium]|nr:porin [Betaproteobacteria bacterium]
MKMKLIVLAVASAIALPIAAQADSSNVRISGYLNMSVDSLTGNAYGVAAGKPGNNASMTNVSSNASNLVLSGDEGLGSGWKAIWQVQTFMTFGGTGNTDPTYSDGLSNGASFVGLSNDSMGTVLAGKIETPMKILGRKVDLFNNELGDTRNIISAGTATGLNKAGTWDNSWDLRTNNTVAYVTPNLSGLVATLAYATNVDTATNVANSVAAESVESLNALYSHGPVFAGVAYERHNLAMSATPYALRLAGGVRLGQAKLVALWQTTKNNYGVSGNDRKAFGVGGAYAMGDNTVKLQYYKTQQFASVSGTDGSLWDLGFDHAMSKRTKLYVAYAEARNGSATAFTPFGGGHGDDPGTVTGKNPHGISLGMIHTF